MLDSPVTWQGGAVEAPPAFVVMGLRLRFYPALATTGVQVLSASHRLELVGWSTNGQAPL